MAGLARMDSIRRQLKLIKRTGVPGAFLEAGVWRGGMSIYARAAMTVYNLTSRTVYLADSFQGLPMPRRESLRSDEVIYAQQLNGSLAVGVEHVLHNFGAYGIATDKVVPVPGYFVDSLPPLREQMVQQKEQRMGLH